MNGLFKAMVCDKKFLSTDVFILRLFNPSIALVCRPGQFVNVRCSSFYEPLLRRPISIFDRDEESFSLLIRVVGKGTRLLSQVEEGEELDVLGPLGKPFPYQEYQNPLLVAGGIGIAPLHFLAKTLVTPTLVYGAKTIEELYVLDELKGFANVLVFTEDGTKGEKGLATSKLPQLIPGHDAIFACGPTGMLKEVVRIAKAWETPSFISLEERMACGFGACLGCAVKTTKGYKMLCKDGPVMRGEEVII